MSAVSPAASGRPRRSMLRNFGSVVLGRLFSAFSMWLALVALAKLSDPATVGLYALAQALCIPVAEVARLGLREILASDAQDRHPFGGYMALRLLAVGVALPVMLAFAALQAGPGAALLVVCLYGVSRAVELLSDMIHGLFQVRERMDHIGRSLSLSGGLSLLLLILGYWSTGSLAAAVLGQVAAQLLVLLLHDLPIARRLAAPGGRSPCRPVWSPAVLGELGRLGLPFALATALVMVSVYLPRLAVEEALGLPALGLFAALAALAMVPVRFVGSIGVAAGPRLARLHAEGERAAFVSLLARLAGVVGGLGLVGVVLAALLGEAVVAAVYTGEFAAQTPLLVWLVAAAALRCVADVLKLGVVAARRFWPMTLQYGAVAVVAVAACVTLVPAWGLTGAGVAMVLIFAAHLAAVAVGLAASLPPRRSPS